jgi:phosphoribosylformylglycinamidine synthase
MSHAKALVLTGYGLNCDIETAYAIGLAGADAVRVHINALIDGSVQLDKFNILVFGGGFSWGDDHGAGVIQAVRMKTNLGDKIQEFISAGHLVLGICNGFQTLVNMGLLPGFDDNYSQRSVAITFNDCGNFRDQWVSLKVNTSSPCVFTRGIDHMELPVRHGEGKFFAAPADIQRLTDNDQVVVQYAASDGQPANLQFPQNPNGSIADIAGICDPSGRIFGLMPHPEAFIHWTNHPEWTRQKEAAKRRGGGAASGHTVGVQLFRNAVDYINNY